MSDPRETRLAEVRAELSDLWDTKETISAQIRLLVEERKALQADIQRDAFPEMEIGEIIRGIRDDKFDYLDGEFNPYRVALDRYNAWVGEHMPKEWTFDFDRWSLEGEKSISQITPKILPRHPKGEHHVDIVEVAEGLKQVVLGTQVALGLDPETKVIFGIMSNDLSAKGILRLEATSGEPFTGQVVRMTYGRDTVQISGSIVECLEYLSLNEWYGDPHTTEEEDYSW